MCFSSVKIHFTPLQKITKPETGKILPYNLWIPDKSPSQSLCFHDLYAANTDCVNSVSHSLCSLGLPFDSNLYPKTCRVVSRTWSNKNTRTTRKKRKKKGKSRDAAAGSPNLHKRLAPQLQMQLQMHLYVCCRLNDVLGKRCRFRVVFMLLIV